ncbi:MAG: pseudouridine synthase [Candidatus Promineifilaceae bacterium]
MEERLQKLMARAGLGSRRANEELIAAGRVRVNGCVAHLGDKADIFTDTIEVDGRALKFDGDQLIYIKLYKPRGIISSLEDEMGQNRAIVRDLVPANAGHIYPVGRLDKQSEGLMLMTNDGQLAHRLTHPRYEHEKVYEVQLEGRISEADLKQWRRGVLLDDRLTAPAKIEVLANRSGDSLLRVTLREGRKRQIRRIAAAFGHPVRSLIRISIGPLQLGNLKPGEWRYLNQEELRQLYQSLSAPSRTKRTNDK